MGPEWLVIKIGGTSVSRADYWENVVARIRQALADGRRVLLVHSALAGTTDDLEALIADDRKTRPRILKELETRHRALSDELALPDASPLDERLEALAALAANMPPATAVTPSQRARLLAMGEYLMSSLALSFLERRGLDVTEVDARELLEARERPGIHAARHYLFATCSDAPDDALARRLRRLSPLVMTQGFIARDKDGDTVLFGRGGSDVSAAYLAAKLRAEMLEIWTDVPGLFTADPREVGAARLLKEVDYAEALEIAATGARVLHPHCIRPLQYAGIPLLIRHTPAPDTPGTRVSACANGTSNRLKAVCIRRNITVVTLETPDMWHQPGFLADAFACFKLHDVSVDMVSTSETSITVTLDPSANPLAGERINNLCGDLRVLGDVGLMTDCAAISLVGRQIRANLHKIAPLLDVFQERKVHLVSQSSNNLNITFVVDESEASKLAVELHALLIGEATDERTFGAAWETLCTPRTGVDAPLWWQSRRCRLLALARERSPRYVYDADTVRARVERLRQLSAVDRLFYAVKANCHAGILGLLYACGLGFECVSAEELKYLLHLFPAISPRRLLFTPNFAPRSEYARALDSGAWITLDNLYPLQAWPELFAGHDILLRVDLGYGSGHHRHVRTAGASSKFGVPLDDLEEARRLAGVSRVRIAGLHAHAGSGITDPSHWHEAGLRLAEIGKNFPDLKIMNLGGGLGVPVHPTDPPLDLVKLGGHLNDLRKALPAERELWLEPGRFLVAEAGVLLARVTQLKNKSGTRYLGVDTGMNSLLRPTLYGAYHHIANLDRFDEPVTENYTVVGPICETGDVLGTERALPTAEEGDVLLIANVGAYGHVMSSSYNMRRAADEIMLEPTSPPALKEPAPFIECRSETEAQATGRRTQPCN